MQAPREAGLREKHGAEFSRADQADRDRPARGFALKQEGVEIHLLRHAAYKTVSLVLGTNIVRKELGAPEAQVLAADERYSLVQRIKDGVA